jgi:hypothetical protein
MQRPIAASDELVMQHSLDELKHEITPKQMARLQRALGILMATHIDPPERQEFLRQVVDGRSARELIAAADLASESYGID